MRELLSSLFSFSRGSEEERKEKDNRKKFDILKYDGIRAQKMNKLPYAIKCFTEALAIEEELETMGHLVGAYTIARENEKALEVLDRMIEIDSTQVNILYSRVSVLFLLDKNAEVLEECSRILALEPSSDIAYFLMGKAKNHLSDLDGAYDELTKSIELNPELPDTFLLRAEVSLHKGTGEAVLSDVEMVISLEGDEESATLLKGQALELLSDKAGAEECYRQVLEMNPFSEKSGLLLTRLLSSLERFTEALELLEEIIELNPSSADAYEERGNIKNLKGDSTDAEADILKAAELRKINAETLADTEKGQDFDKMYKGGIY